MADPILVHYLLVTDIGDGERDIEVVHDSACPYEEDPSGLEDVPDVRFYTCGVGQTVSANGLDDLADDEAPDGREPLDPKALEPGRYEIAAWSHHHPSTVNGPEEWEGGLRFVHRACGVPGCPEPVTETLKGKAEDRDGDLADVVVGVCGHHHRQITVGILDHLSIARDGAPVVSSSKAQAAGG